MLIAELHLKYMLMKLFIKNMVSIRCKLMVKAEIEGLGMHPVIVELGEVKIKEIFQVKSIMP